MSTTANTMWLFYYTNAPFWKWVSELTGTYFAKTEAKLMSSICARPLRLVVVVNEVLLPKQQWTMNELHLPNRGRWWCHKCAFSGGRWEWWRVASLWLRDVTGKVKLNYRQLKLTLQEK